MESRSGVSAGALGIAITGAVSAAALAQTPNIPMKVADRSVSVTEPVRVSGNAGREFAGRTIQLELAGPDGSWRALGTTTVRADGGYEIARRLPRPGRLRVVLVHPPGTAAAASEPRSAEATIAVAPRVRVGYRRLDVRAGRRLALRGRLTPARAGRRVALQVRDRHGWRTIDRDRTSAAGAYVLRDRMQRTLSARARVAVAPYAGLSRGARAVGRLNVYRVAYASWYGPGFYGQRMGCGGTLHAGRLGVAHKWLPCGTKVTFRHRGRTVRVRVIDRGPYVGSREYDLTEATAQRLGFRGHGPVLSTR